MSVELEEWRETQYPGYFVSSLGRVRGRKGGILRPGVVGAGYLHVACGRGNLRRVHRLVAEAFFGPDNVGLDVAHLNGNPADNRVGNLAYKTRKENEADKVLHGRAQRRGAVGVRNSHAKLTEEQVREIRAAGPLANKSALSRHYGVSRAVIAGIINGTIWRHLS